MSDKEMILKAAKLIDKEEYNEFKKMNFGNDDMISITNEVRTLKGIEYLDKEGLIPEKYFSNEEVIFASSPEQVDFYISKGARVNDTQKFWNYEDNCEEKLNFLDLVVSDCRFSSQNVESVIKAGGKFAYNVIDFQDLEKGLIKKKKKKMVDKIKVLNKANMLDNDTKQSTIELLSSSYADTVALLANPQQVGVDYLQLKSEILKNKLSKKNRKTAHLGKTGDIKTGEVREEHKNVAQKQAKISKALMTEYAKGKNK